MMIHLVLGLTYSVTFIYAYKSLKRGDLERAAKLGIVTALAVGLDVGLYYLGVGLFS
ncbi:MAG: hypothetical protein JXP34_10555 [Planctomycetes bacterium]|nr:hypothetical protein [Planctomycetota bacterium]